MSALCASRTKINTESNLKKINFSSPNTPNNRMSSRISITDKREINAIH